MLDLEEFQRYLPLPPTAHVVMVALADTNRDARGIVEEIARDSGGQVNLHVTKVMEAVRKLKVRDLVAESPLQPDPENGDDLTRYYSLTVLGMKVAAAETQRLAYLIYAACDKKLVTRAQLTSLRRSTSGAYRF